MQYAVARPLSQRRRRSCFVLGVPRLRNLQRFSHPYRPCLYRIDFRSFLANLHEKVDVSNESVER